MLSEERAEDNLYGSGTDIKLQPMKRCYQRLVRSGDDILTHRSLSKALSAGTRVSPKAHIDFHCGKSIGIRRMPGLNRL